MLISSASSTASNVRTEDPKETPKKARFGANYSDPANTPFKEEVEPGMAPPTLNLKK